MGLINHDNASQAKIWIGYCQCLPLRILRGYCNGQTKRNWRMEHLYQQVLFCRIVTIFPPNSQYPSNFQSHIRLTLYNYSCWLQLTFASQNSTFQFIDILLLLIQFRAFELKLCALNFSIIIEMYSVRFIHIVVIIILNILLEFPF